MGAAMRYSRMHCYALPYDTMLCEAVRIDAVRYGPMQCDGANQPILNRNPMFLDPAICLHSNGNNIVQLICILLSILL